MKCRSLVAASMLAICVALPIRAQAARPDPHLLVDSAIAAMGGKSMLEGLTAIRITASQHEYVLGNAERAEGPWRAQYSNFVELWDVNNRRLRHTAVGSAPATPSGAPVRIEQVTIVTDSVMAMQTGAGISSGYAGFYEDYQDKMNGSPVRVLLEAAAAPSLRWERRVVRFGVPQDVVSYRTAAGSIRIEIDRYSHLPMAVEIFRHPVLEVRRTIFGDATIRIEYVDWTAQADGLWWPMQHRFLFNGEMARDLTIRTLDAHAVATADSFLVADSTRAAFAKSILVNAEHFKLGSRPEPPQPGGDIVRLADNWAMTLVKQGDGVVVFEAHLSQGYIKQVVEEIHRRWPGAPIKAFVLTSDPWAHLGGVREVVALGIPIYVQAASIPFLTGIAKAPFTLSPDDLARTPKTPKFVAVDGKTIIGTGENRIELYPVRGAYAERMLMAYFPQRRLLYGADLVFPGRGPSSASSPQTFSPTPALELRRAVAREKLQVDSLFCVQASYPIYAWKDFIPTGAHP